MYDKTDKILALTGIEILKQTEKKKLLSLFNEAMNQKNAWIMLQSIS